ncbi:MAG: PPC domain-containing DNA-binding protein [Promethearchaeota archaeon]
MSVQDVPYRVPSDEPDKEVRYQATSGKLGKVIIGRLLSGTDVIEGIEKICKDHNIKSAFVSVSIGSLQKATFLLAMAKQGTKLGIVYTEPIEVPGPIEFLSGLGIVCEGEKEGELETHFHATFSNEKQEVYGGHLVKGKNPTLATIDLSIIEVKGIKIARKFDEETGFVLISPEPV